MGRWQPFSFAHNDQFYVCRGGVSWRDKGKYTQDQCLPLQRFDFSSAQWSGVTPECVDHEEQEKRYWKVTGDDAGVCCAVLGNCAYTYGGRWKYAYAVHELNLETMVWRRLEPKNGEDGPMQKDKAGMVTCGDEALCVFGGYRLDIGRRQPGATYHSDRSNHGNCWTNELHLFHVKTGQSVLHVKGWLEGRSV